MIQYSKLLSIAPNFRRSTNILYDGSNCESYILSTSSIESLRRVFVTKTSNALALIGPFGSGKSSFLLFLEALLAKSTGVEKCIEKLLSKDDAIYHAYSQIVDVGNKKFVTFKIVGEHHSLKKALLSTLLENELFNKTHELIRSDQNVEIRKLLRVLNKEIHAQKFSGALFVIDELGKFIEYASEAYAESDIHTLQDLAEYVNSQENYRLVVALHKNIRDYVQNATRISYSEWDKIQGRFENVFFQDDFYELMHVFQESFEYIDIDAIGSVQNRIEKIFEDYVALRLHTKLQVSKNTLKNLAPLHPFCSVALFHIFSKYFQNQRSIFTFLSAQEPHSFQEFINNPQDELALYGLPKLFDYIEYLTKAYSVNMIDKESWQRAKEYLEYGKVNTPEETSIIKAIALISAFKLEHVIRLNDASLLLALPEFVHIDQAISALKQKGLILFKKEKRSYALIEEATIDIDQAITEEVYKLVNIDYEEKINAIIGDEPILAKRFFIEKGTGKFFTKLFVDSSNIESVDTSFQLVYVASDVDRDKLLDVSKKNRKSIFCIFQNVKRLTSYIDEMIAIAALLEQKDKSGKKSIRRILESRALDYKKQSTRLVNTLDKLIFRSKEFEASTHKIQSLMSEVFESTYPQMPIIHNVMVNDVRKLSSVPLGVKQLFEHMINNADKEYFGIKKTPAEKAMYLSIVKKSGLHIKVDEQWQIVEPKECNFSHSWSALENFLRTGEKIALERLIDYMQGEPYGLNSLTAQFYIFLFLISHERNINFFRDNTYSYVFDIHEVMYMWKNPGKYTLHWFELSDEQEEVFAQYLKLFSHLVDLGYSKQGIKTVSQSLFKKFDKLPAYCRQTQQLSDKAKKLRSAILSSKEPNKTFFVDFPKALGFDKLNANNAEEYIEAYRQVFNEIVFSYKNIILELEAYIAKVFSLLDPHYPYANELSTLFERFAEADNTLESSKFYRVFTSSYGVVEFVNDLAFVLMEKKVSVFYDHDVIEFKKQVDLLAQGILTKVDIADIVKNKSVEAKKLKITSLNGSNERIVSVDKSKMVQLNALADQILRDINAQLSDDEKAFIASLMAEKVWREDSE